MRNEDYESDLLVICALADVACSLWFAVATFFGQIGFTL